MPFELATATLWVSLRRATDSLGERIMATVKGLGHVAIYVRDLERMVEFYRDLLGTHHQAELARRRRISKRRSGERGS